MAFNPDTPAIRSDILRLNQEGKAADLIAMYVFATHGVRLSVENVREVIAGR